MSEEVQAALQLLEDIDRRQDEVLAELDELNTRIEGLIARNLPSRPPVAEAA